MFSSSTLTLTDGSSIYGNSAKVSSPAFAVASRLVVESPSDHPTPDRCERETSQ